ncbi:MAG: PilZ domain-containing protein [Deltaproteobacteria bacterium]
MKRFDLKLKARVSLKSDSKDRKWSDAVTSSISAAGAFLRMREPFPIGSRLDFEAVLPLRDKDSKVKDSLVKMSGVVTRTEEAGMAICFDDGYTILPFPKPVLH